MQRILIVCLCLCSLGMPTNATIVDIPKSQTWEWSHDLVPDVGLSVRVTTRSGGFATVYISYSAKPTLDSFEEKHVITEGPETIMYFPGKTPMVYALVKANDGSDVSLEGYVMEGEIYECDFNFCATGEKCIAISDYQLVCTAA